MNRLEALRGVLTRLAVEADAAKNPMQKDMVAGAIQGIDALIGYHQLGMQLVQLGTKPGVILTRDNERRRSEAIAKTVRELTLHASGIRAYFLQQLQQVKHEDQTGDRGNGQSTGSARPDAQASQDAG